MYGKHLLLLLVNVNLIYSEFVRIKVPITVKREDLEQSYLMSSWYQLDKVQLWIQNKKLSNIIKLGKNNDTTVKWIVMKECGIENLSKGCFEDYTNLNELSIYLNEIEEILAGVFHGPINKIYLRKNKISHIEDKAFNNLPKLTDIILADNQIETINSSWFSNCPKLGYFSLPGNKIQRITNTAFNNLSGLHTIKLDFNNISTIDPGAFAALSDLTGLYLSFNKITVLPPEIFPPFMDIERLDISFNLLNYVPQETLKKIHTVRINYTPNPWKCKCFLKLQQHLNKARSRLYVYESCRGPEYPVCATSENYEDTCVESIDSDLTKHYYDNFWKLCAKDLFDYNSKPLEFVIPTKDF